MRWRLEISMYLLAYDLIDRSYSDEYTATEKWRLCWGLDIPSGFAYFSHFVVLYLWHIFVQFGMTVLIVMCELLDIQLLFALVICEMSSIPELECTLG